MVGLKIGFKSDWSDKKASISIPLSIIGGIGTFISLICFLTEGAIFKLLNPHYYAVKAIIEMGSRLIR